MLQENPNAIRDEDLRKEVESEPNSESLPIPSRTRNSSPSHTRTPSTSQASASPKVSPGHEGDGAPMVAQPPAPKFADPPIQSEGNASSVGGNGGQSPSLSSFT